MLLPLFPTMYGQLSAIAREFNFPSTTGICLYFHFTENGITATPRISDESWQMIWSNVFDPSFPAPRVPIVGKVEFDIDIRHARWYSAWIASTHREHVDVPASVGPSTAPSLAHFRGDSRNTELEINFQDDQLDNESISPPSITRHGRHVPKKLSLVDRLDSSLRAVARTATAAAHISPEHSASARALSPIFQEDEPKTAKLEDSLAKRVKSWRASASLTPSALAAKGQTSLEPANLPNTMSLDGVADGEDMEELNLEDFTWSVSSLGPNDWEEGSVASRPRLPSVHLANRMESSVCMTPSVCTSFGPSDYTLPSPIPSWARVMTPDIAHRMYEDCPPTPSTATSWGPPSEYPASPISFGSVSSVDLGDRAVFSPPPTPMTATSWGPPSEYPQSPMSFGRAPSVHLGDRLVFSPPPTPSTATTWGPASWPSSPITPFYVQTPDVGQRAFDPEDLALPSAPWKQVWPYHQQHLDTVSGPESQVSPYNSAHAPSAELTMSVHAPWGHSWPYHSYAGQDLSPVTVRPACSYPSLKIYPSVYPYFDDLYPAKVLGVKSTMYLSSIDIYPAVDQHQKSNKLVNVKIVSGWPTFEIYPPVAIAEQSQSSYTRHISTPVSVHLPCSYPSLKIYPSVYPYFDLYPAAVLSVKPVSYLSSIDIYPAVDQHQKSDKVVNVKVVSAWPTFEIYPPVVIAEQSQSLETRHGSVPVSVRLPCSYPSLKIYPSVYPYFDDLYPAEVEPTSYLSTLDIYPVVDQGHQGHQLSRVIHVEVASAWPIFEIYPSVDSAEKSHTTYARNSPVSVRLPYSYPTLRLYPSVYPYFDDLYPAQPSITRSYPDSFIVYPAIKQLSKVVHVKVVSAWPVLEIYPPVTSIEQSYNVHTGHGLSSISVRIPCTYPSLKIYPSVYPYFDDLYPAKPQTEETVPYPQIYPPTSGRQDSAIIEIYPAMGKPFLKPITRSSLSYPLSAFDIYPPVQSEAATQNWHSLSESKPAGTVNPSSAYPIFDLYPAVYPRNSSSFAHPVVFAVSNTCKTRQYPDFILYPCRQYPDFNLYPPQENKDQSIPKTVARYGVFDLYPAVYPHILPYTPMMSVVRPSKSSSTVMLQEDVKKIVANLKGHRSHRELHDEYLLVQSEHALGLVLFLTGRLALNDEPRTVHKKRDSVVLRRIRAFEETDPDSTRHSLNRTLKEFPLPPPPPPPTGSLPPVPIRRTPI
ncbi:salivary gland secretion 1 [Lentinula edodes]|uniref:Salivary gland secretion 1 n=1 Tax=Lentinula edodes TaxID=5353 RepID=A0A1Q3EDT1_LENED|nr:salivary gland secretion 1 [Lentinula edodes]